MIAPHLAPVPDPDEDDRPIIRRLRAEVRERLAQLDAERPTSLPIESDARIRLVVHEVVDAYQRRALSTTNTPRLADPVAAERELLARRLSF